MEVERGRARLGTEVVTVTGTFQILGPGKLLELEFLALMIFKFSAVVLNELASALRSSFSMSPGPFIVKLLTYITHYPVGDVLIQVCGGGALTQ